ncbi:MAG: UDP-N-acetylmuramate dehydrogenase [Nitrospirota bacterium]
MEIRYNEPMSNHTSFRIGGPAEMMVFPDNLPELKHIVSDVRSKDQPVFILGKGTNLLVRDGGIKGVVINFMNLNSMKIVKECEHEILIYIQAGASISDLIRFSISHGFSGIEFLSGIPGSIGGAICMNAGTAEKGIGNIVETVTVLTENTLMRRLRKDELSFGYRSSNIQDGWIILSTILKLVKDDPDRVKERVNKVLAERSANQPKWVLCAGSIFKNPSGYTAGKIIDELGLKGKKIGGAEVSHVHANFIVNTGNATASDVIGLIGFIKKKVREARGIELELEIKIVGDE